MNQNLLDIAFGFQGNRPIRRNKLIWPELYQTSVRFRFFVHWGQEIIRREHIRAEGKELNLLDVCVNGEYPKLISHSVTVVEQPLIFLASLAEWEIIKAIIPNNARTGFFGHSYGIWPAVVAANYMSAEAGFLAAVYRGLITSTTKGISLLLTGKNLDIREIRYFCQQEPNVHLALINSSDQVVLAGAEDGIHSVQKLFLKTNPSAKARLIDTGAPYHTKHMDEAYRELKCFLKHFPFRHSNVPVLTSNGNWTCNPQTIKHWMLRQTNRPVDFRKMAKALPLMVIEVAVPPDFLYISTFIQAYSTHQAPRFT